MSLDDVGRALKVSFKAVRSFESPGRFSFKGES
jgi:hypothetical protein